MHSGASVRLSRCTLSWPALANFDPALPVQVENGVEERDQTCNSALSRAMISLVLVRVLPAVPPSKARVLRTVREDAHEQRAGTPLPETSPMANARRFWSIIK